MQQIKAGWRRVTEHWSGLVIVALLLVVVPIWAYQTIYPYFTPSPIRYEYDPADNGRVHVLTPRVQTSGTVEVRVRRCNDTPYPALYLVDRRLQRLDGTVPPSSGETVYVLPDTSLSMDAGPRCETLITNVSLAPVLPPPGRYVLKGTTSARNYWGRQVLNIWQSQEFEVTP